MSPEEAHALLNRIALLHRLGEKSGTDPALVSGPGYDSSDNYRIDGWLSEVEDLVSKNFDGNSAFVDRAKVLTSGVDGTKLDLPDARRMALDLLDTVKDFVFIDPDSVATEPLRNLIEQTLSERYFKSWEMRLLVAAFGLVITCFFGGTIYLGFQAQGVANTAEVARKSIESERDSVVKLGNDVVQRIEAKATEEASAQIAKLHAAIDASTTSITELNAQLKTNRTTLDQTFKDGETTIRKSIEDAVNQAPTNANAYLASKQPLMDAAMARLNASIESSANSITELTAQLKRNQTTLDQAFKDGETSIRKSVDDAVNQVPTNANAYLASKQPLVDAAMARLNASIESSANSITELTAQLKRDQTTLDQAFKDGEKEIKQSTKDAVGQIPTSANSYLASKQPMMDAAIDKELAGKIGDATSRIQSKLDDASRQIQDKVDVTNMRARNFEDALPDIAKYRDNRVREFDDIVNRYSEPIGAILSRFTGSKELTAIQSVSLVLGRAVWLIVVSVGVASVAFVAAIWAWTRGRRKRLLRLVQAVRQNP